MKIDVNKFISFLKLKGLKDRTIDKYVFYLFKFDSPVFNQETVNEFLSRPSNRNTTVARGFIVNLRKYIKLNFKTLGFNEEMVTASSLVELPKLTGRKKKRLINPLVLEDVAKIESCLENEKEKIMLWLSFYGGFRLTELMTLRFNNFNTDKWKLNKNMPIECNVIGKGDQEEIIFTIPPKLFNRVMELLKEDVILGPNDYLFIKDKEGSKIRNFGRTWQNHLKEAGIKAGITKLDQEGKPIPHTIVHPHRLRHSCGTYLKNVLKWDIRDVQEGLRHASITSTQIYTHIDKEDLKKKFMENENK